MRIEPKIGIDIDGVIADSDVALRQAILDSYGVHIPPCGERSYTPKVEGVPYEDVLRTINNRIADDEILPFDGTIEAMNILHEAIREPITLITARPEYIRDHTLDWLKTHFPDVRFDVIFSEDKLGPSRERNINVFIEDRFKTANDLANYMQGVYLVNRPWNENREVHWKVIRVDSFQDAIRRYLGIVKKKYHLE